MDMEMALRSALVIISQMHILAAEADRAAQAMNLISGSIRTLVEAKEAERNAAHDKQGEDV